MNLTCSRCQDSKPVAAFYRDKSKSSGYTSTCKSCNKELSRQRYARREKPARITLAEKSCKECATAFMPVHPSRLYCSDKCRHRNWNRKLNPDYKTRAELNLNVQNRRERVPTQMVLTKCIWCSTLFAPWHPGMKNCSPACSEAFRDNKATGNHARRARKYGVHYEHVQRHLVFERDNWTCQLCHLPIDPDVAYPDKECATIDHIKPMSKGGDHVLGNLQAAHWSCNAAKGNRDEVATVPARALIGAPS